MHQEEARKPIRMGEMNKSKPKLWLTFIPLRASRERKSRGEEFKYIMIDTMYYVHRQTRLLYRWMENLKCVTIKQVWAITEVTHNGSTAVQKPVLVLLVSALALRSTTFYWKDLCMTEKINDFLHYLEFYLNFVRLTIVLAPDCKFWKAFTESQRLWLQIMGLIMIMASCVSSLSHRCTAKRIREGMHECEWEPHRE